MKIDFGAACKDLFSTEKKWNTILGLAVCTIIPVVGPLVALGYLFRRFSRERSGLGKDDFDFSYFSNYLTAGVWPFVSTLVLSFCVMPLVFLAEIPIFGAVFVAEENEVLAIILGVVGFILYIAVLILITLLTYPVMLRSGLMMDFKAGFSKSFILGFIKKVGGSLLLWIFVIALLAYPAMILGVLAFFVGVFVVAVWIQFAMFHLLFQHYDLYLHRGGEPIEINPELIQDIGNPPLPQTSLPTSPELPQ